MGINISTYASIIIGVIVTAYFTILSQLIYQLHPYKSKKIIN